MPWHRTSIRRSELRPGDSREVVIDDRCIGLFNVDGRLYALDNLCPHQNAALSDGRLEGNVITCPLHGWQFNVTTGTSVVTAATRTDSFPVRDDAGYVSIELPTL